MRRQPRRVERDVEWAGRGALREQPRRPGAQGGAEVGALVRDHGVELALAAAARQAGALRACEKADDLRALRRAEGRERRLQRTHRNKACAEATAVARHTEHMRASQLDLQRVGKVEARRQQQVGEKRQQAQLHLQSVQQRLSLTAAVSDLPCDIRREGGQSLVIETPSLVILEGKECNPL